MQLQIRHKFNFQVSSDEGESETEDDRNKECIYLNSVRANFTACCQYPLIVTWRFIFATCGDECGWSYCCHFICVFKALKVLEEKSDGSGRLELKIQGIINSFLMSVGNDSMWLPVLQQSVNTCFDQLNGSSDKNFCEGENPN